MEKLKLGLAAFVIIFGVSFCKGQEGKMKKTPEVKSEHMTKRLNEQLQLNEEQVVKVRSLNENLTQEMNAMREEMRKRRKAMRAEYNNNMQSVLTPEQFQKFKDIRKEKRENTREKHQGKHDHPHPHSHPHPH